MTRTPCKNHRKRRSAPVRQFSSPVSSYDYDKAVDEFCSQENALEPDVTGIHPENILAFLTAVIFEFGQHKRFLKSQMSSRRNRSSHEFHWMKIEVRCTY